MKLFVVPFLLIFFMNSFCYAQDEPVDIDLLNIEKISDTASLTNANTALLKLINKKEFDESIIYANKLLDRSKHIKSDFHTGLFYFALGSIKSLSNFSTEAIINYEQAAIYFEKVDHLSGLASAKNNIGIIEKKLGNLEKSADYSLESIMLYKRLKDTSGILRSYSNLGNAYNSLKDFENSKKYYHQALTIKKNRKDSDIHRTLNNMAHLYINNKKIDSANFFLNTALKIAKENKDYLGIAQAYSLTAKVYLAKKKYQTTIKYYDSTLSLSEKANWKALMVNAEQQMGLVSIHLKDYNKADKLLASSREEFKKLKATELLLKNYEYTSKLDSTRGDYASALAWQKKYQKLSNERMLNDSKSKVNATKKRYETQLKHLQLIDQQERKAQQDKASLFRYRILIYVILGILFIAFILIVIITRTRKERKRYITQLNDSNEVKTKLFSIISHDLTNQISGLDGSLKLMKENAFSPEEFQEIIPLLSNNTHQTSILLNNLLNWSKSQMKELYAKPTRFNVTEVIESKFSYFASKAKQKNIKLVNKLNSTSIYADKDMFGIIAQNLIANAIKFCDSGDVISLFSEERNDCWTIYFKDTGVGIEPHNLSRLFAEDIFTTNGTQNETGTGLGLKICKELVELNNGKIHVDSALGEGSTFRISLPKTA